MKTLFEFFDAQSRVEKYFNATPGKPGKGRPAEAELARLAELKRARIKLDECLRELELDAAKQAFLGGARWVDIADAAGVTRQTAQATYRDRSNRPRTRQSSARDDASWPEAFDE